MPELFFLAIAGYLAYRFLVGFLLPIYQSTREVKRQFRHMRQPGGSGSDPQGNPDSHSNAKPKGKSKKVGEYIDFEEVK
jgi:hypothetical protein